MIDHKNKFIFIHIPRTGGTSIELAFDFDSSSNKYAHKHLSASQTKNLVGEKKWNEYFKMALIRNPYDRIISAWKRGFYENKKSDDLYDFLLKYKPASHEYSSFVYSDILDLNLDYIGKFENLNEEFNFLKKKYNLNSNLPTIEKSTRSKCYQLYYTKKTKAIVSYIYRKDLKRFNYEFNDANKSTKFNLIQGYFFIAEFFLKKKILKVQNSRAFRFFVYLKNHLLIKYRKILTLSSKLILYTTFTKKKANQFSLSARIYVSSSLCQFDLFYRTEREIK